MNTTLFILFAVIFLILDIVWIQFFSIFFGPMIAKIQNAPMTINTSAILPAYIIMLLSYYFLVFNEPNPSYLKIAILGLGLYGTYEFTNLTTFKNWNLNVLAIDISWGVFVSVFSLYLANKTKSYLSLANQ